MKSNKKPFYKQWWAVTIAFILVFFAGYIIGAAGASGDDETNEASVSSSSKDSSKTSTADRSSGKSNAKQILTVDYKVYEIASEKSFKPNYKTAKTYKYDSANDGKFNIQGFLQLHYVIKTKADVSVYPTQGTYIYSNGEQHEADSTESWDGDISKNVSKQGTVTVPVEQISNVKSVRVKFDASGQDFSDDSLDHDFDFTITLH